VIGLGTGTLAAYGHPRDQFRFYDINPEVIAIARTEFGFLAHSQAQIETVLGDARLVLEAEAPNQFDVLVVDAFSGDSIPVHLITREALAVYRRHVKAGGIIAFHVSNRFLALAPVVRELALDQQLQAVLISDQPERPLLKTDWVLVSDSAQALSKTTIASVALPAPSLPGLSVWTDDTNNLFKILK
jgi:spermidine synthase